ncbi:hypothetical protein RhiirA5_412312 [Rhizophagus irregularis]|uniref:Uncharacterized protein n=1 Tax=Rhizophagus irregularis TaxID=588596 RepID=A0A2I1DZI1_9GLOM|nr:hypothetical protein RhiirA5_412312 [Rhizophagus irregularis]PKY15283.1 hypothetical protein RhiirB3_427453 [Rhizophagus irregularis]
MNAKKSKNAKSSSNKITCLLYQFTDNSTLLYTKNKLSLHQRQLHPNNRLVPHIQQSLLDNISDTQVRSFWNSLLARIEKSFHMVVLKAVPDREAGYNRLGYLFDCKDWGEKNHISGTKAYVFMESEERKKDVSFI